MFGKVISVPDPTLEDGIGITFSENSDRNPLQSPVYKNIGGIGDIDQT